MHDELMDALSNVDMNRIRNLEEEAKNVGQSLANSSTSSDGESTEQKDDKK
jgi:hypothetical protein